MAATRGSRTVKTVANVETTTPKVKSLFIDALTPVEAMLDSDSKGEVLLFDPKEAFVKLDDATVRAFSADNRARYQHALDFNRVWRGKSEFDGDINVDLQLVSKPNDKLEYTPREGMVGYWARPENVRDRMAKGWRVADKETESFLGMTGGAHRITRNGQDELILMERSESDQKRALAAHEAENTRRAGLKTRVVSSEAAQAGLIEYDEAKDRSDRPWNDLATADKAGEE